MKKLTTLIVLIMACQMLIGQMSYEFSTWLKTEPNTYALNLNLGQVARTKKQAMTPWKVTGIAVFATVAEAIGDGMYDNGNKMPGKAFQATSLASHFLYIPVMQNSNANWLLIPIIEMCWRFILFDAVYNLTRGLPIGYIGNTSYWDKGMQSFAPPTGMRLFADGVATAFVIKFTFDKL